MVKSDSNKSCSTSGKQVEAYLKSTSVINGLIDKQYLSIDIKNRYVEIDYFLHINLFDYESDDAYIAFFDKISAWMNFQYGLLGSKTVVNPNERINCMVFRPDQVFMNDEDEEINITDYLSSGSPNIKMKTKRTPLLVGYCENRKLVLETYEEPDEDLED